jgi:hypothetical protein
VHRACRALGASALSVSILLLAEPSRADGSAQADALFREGRKAMVAKDWARAAALLAESQRVSPAPGTLLNLALAETELGRLASASEHARAAREGLSASDDRARIAGDLHTSLERRVPKLVLVPAPGFPADASVTLDGTEVRPASFQIALPVDPGRHEIVVRSPAHANRAVVVRLAEAQRLEETLREGAPLSDKPSGETTAKDERTKPSSGWRTAGWITLGASGVFLLGGTVLGGFAYDRNATVEDRCRGRYCDTIGLDAANEGRTFATASTIGFVGAGVFAVAGAAILLFGPR